ncbi:MAG: DNA topoisomerase (ATP-hydrolyzing) subunit B [SAR202 cluster bacterium]|nr:DNA topoisomerase (ATP-hydrolyzing) subunit B [SAR202 cluster bacterium]
MVQQRQSQYTADQIQVLEGLEAVRRRPGMYIGSTDQRGLHHLVYEIVDNAVDEAMAGFCDRILITMHKDGAVSVVDNGRGIPVDLHPATKKSALETVMTVLHAGGKFGGGAYKVSGGLHGVGASVVNALSEWLRVDVRRDGFHYRQEFARGVAKAPVAKLGPMLPGEQRGSTVTFMPDTQMFGPLSYDHAVLLQRFREMAYLNKGVWITFAVEADPEAEMTFHFEEGIANFVKHLNAGKEVLHPDPFYTDKTIDGTQIEIALQYNGGFYESTFAFANGINTVDGGTHLAGFRAGLTRVINNYSRKAKLVKDDTPNLTGDDVREGLTAVVSVRLAEPQFEGQTKGKLGNAETRPQVEQVLVEQLEYWLEEHPNEARRIIDKCVTAQRAREAARKARDLVIRKNAMEGGSLPGKLADCSERSPELCEIYVVEGESAGGSAKMGRDRRTQAILPLKGKILNVEKARADRMLAHEEIRALITAIGAGLGEDFNLAKLRYHKVIIMTDADVDGAHIRTLLLTFFFRNMRQLIDNGYLYIAQPPLYRVARGRNIEYKYQERDKDEWLATQLFGRMSIHGEGSKDKALLSGRRIQDLIRRLREFQSWAGSLEPLGVQPALVGPLFKGALQGRYRLEYNDDTVRALAEWLREEGFTVLPDTDPKTKQPILHKLRVEGAGSLDVKQIIESPAAARSLSLFPQVADWVNGKTFAVQRRDNVVAEGVQWHELAGVLERHSERGGVSLQRYKGLGEMNPEQLWETTMNPATRTLLRVDVTDAADADKAFSQLMGDEVGPRKEWIQANAVKVKNLDV